MPDYLTFRIVLQWLHPKDDERNLISATFHMMVITLISMSMVDLVWFTISDGSLNDNGLPYLTLGQFFWFGYTNESTDYSDYDFINSTIVNMMRITILLCFMAIIFSLAGFFLDIVGPKSTQYKTVRRYAVPGTCTVLWIMAIVSISYYIILLLEDSLVKQYPKEEPFVSYGCGFYVLIAAGGFALIGIFYNLILAHHPPASYYRDDCLIDGGFDEDGFDTFNSPTPPPPYNVPPPPPYTP